MRALSLFSGVGLHDLGLQRAGWTLAGQCECDPWCLAVLEKHWPGLPRWEDVRHVSGDSVAERCGRIDLVTGGFPCQDISSAGRGVGLSGSRSGLWYEMLRVVREVRPAWVFAENVPALRLRGADVVVAGLEEAGYSVLPPVVVGAWAIGAPHKRERAWVVGYSVSGDAGRLRKRGEAGSEEFGRLPGRAPWQRTEAAGGSELAHAEGDRVEGERLSVERGRRLADTDGGGRSSARWPARPGEPQHGWEAPRLAYASAARREGSGAGAHEGWAGLAEGCGRPPESGLGRAADGRPGRLDGFARRNRLRALGNANPPVVPELIGRWMLAQDATP